MTVIKCSEYICNFDNVQYIEKQPRGQDYVIMAVFNTTHDYGSFVLFKHSDKVVVDEVFTRISSLVAKQFESVDIDVIVRDVKLSLGINRDN